MPGESMGTLRLETAGRARDLVTRRLAWTRRLEEHGGLIALVVYVGMALVWARAALAHMDSACPCGLPGDASQYAWALEWFPHALLSGESLLHSNAMWAPTGLNLAGNAGVPVIAFLVSPVTLIWGPIVAYNVVAISAPAAAAWSAYWLCRYVSRNTWAALLAGATYGFSTYEIGQLYGHINLYEVVCPPLAVLCVLRLIDGSLSRRRFTIFMTVVLLVQVFISTEVFFELVVLGALALLFAWVFADRPGRLRLQGALPSIALSLALTVVLSSWYVIPGLSAGAYAKDAGPIFYPVDVLGFFVPSPFTWIGGSDFTSVSSLFPAGPVETVVYIGLPLTAIVVRLIAVRWPRREAKLLTVLLVCTILWILGSHLVIASKVTIWLPYSIIAHLPGFDELLQGRVALFFELICAVALAMWLVNSRRHLILRWVCGLLAVLFVVPNFVHVDPNNTGVWENPAFYKTSVYKRYIRKGQTVLPIRWGFLSEAYMWQAEDHMYYKLASGYFTWHPLPSWSNQLTNDLWNDTPTAGDAALLRQFVAERHVADVVVQDGEEHLWAATLAASGLRVSAKVGGVTLYRVPASWRAGTDRAS